MNVVIRSCSIFILFLILATITPCIAGDLNFNVCEQVSARQLSEIYSSKLFPKEELNGCRWSDKPGGIAYFQIGIIKSQNNLKQFFQKEIPTNYKLKKIDGLGDRGLMTEAKGYIDVIVIRKGDWVLISTVDLLYIKNEDARQKILWDIYHRILQTLQ